MYDEARGETLTQRYLLKGVVEAVERGLAEGAFRGEEETEVLAIATECLGRLGEIRKRNQYFCALIRRLDEAIRAGRKPEAALRKLNTLAVAYLFDEGVDPRDVVEWLDVLLSAQTPLASEETLCAAMRTAYFSNILSIAQVAGERLLKDYPLSSLRCATLFAMGLIWLAKSRVLLKGRSENVVYMQYSWDNGSLERSCAFFREVEQIAPTSREAALARQYRQWAERTLRMLESGQAGERR